MVGATILTLTHTDFVIFNKLDKMPVLVVEVDGYAFHANNPKQLARDKMKDTILQKYGITLIRQYELEKEQSIKGRFGVAHIKKIHRYIFQDTYEGAFFVLSK